MPRRLAASVLFSASLLVSGCGGSWAWRDKTYPLPEQAVAAQKRDLDREVSGVAKLVDEDKLKGRAVALLASSATLVRQTSTGDSTMAYYRSGLAANEAAAGAKAADRAGLFAGGCETSSVDEPGDTALPGNAAWALLYLPRASDGGLQWWLVATATGRAIAVADVPPTGEDRFDRFVESLQGAAKRLSAGEGFDFPPGTSTHHYSGASVWMPGKPSHDGGTYESSASGLSCSFTGDRNNSGDADVQLGAAIALVAKGGRAGARVDLPPTAPATKRARVLITFAASTRIVEIQAAQGRMALVAIDGPAMAVRTSANLADNDLADDRLAPAVRRVLGSLRLDP